jgi:hypothetical protein
MQAVPVQPQPQTPVGPKDASQPAAVAVAAVGQEKFAALTPNRAMEQTPGVIPSSQTEEKKTVVAEAKKLTAASRQVGTHGANREVSMSASTANPLPATDFLTGASLVAGEKFQAGALAAPAEAATPAAVQAPRLVQEIRAIADRISSIDRNTVEVRFDFSESDRLSVRVEYRDGAVHTTFRTDSAPLREAIAQQWQAQATPADQRNYRLAEPVFTGNSAASQDFNASGDRSGSDSSRFSEQHAGRNPAAPSQSGRGTSVSSSLSPAANPIRTDSSHLFHRFA